VLFDNLITLIDTLLRIYCVQLVLLECFCRRFLFFIFKKKYIMTKLVDHDASGSYKESKIIIV